MTAAFCPHCGGFGNWSWESVVGGSTVVQSKTCKHTLLGLVASVCGEGKTKSRAGRIRIRALNLKDTKQQTIWTVVELWLLCLVRTFLLVTR